jgi:hypothetical protein
MIGEFIKSKRKSVSEDFQPTTTSGSSTQKTYEEKDWVEKTARRKGRKTCQFFNKRR